MESFPEPNQRAWSFCDGNQDGRISETELRDCLSSQGLGLAGKSFKEITEMANKLFDELDITGDGRLTGIEAIACLHFDRNADGRIMKDESCSRGNFERFGE